MSKTSKKMFSNMYEGEILDLDTIEELEELAPVKSNKAIKRAAKKGSDIIKPLLSSKNSIATNPVDANCNKCGNKIIGELVSDIYLPHADKVMPLISYSCTSCGHIGRRSVVALALPLDQYERKYFN